MKANVIKIELKARRSHSVGPGIKATLKIDNNKSSNNNIVINKEINNGKKETNLFKVKKIGENKTKQSMNIVKVPEKEKEENNEEEEEESIEETQELKDIKGDTYLISKEKIVNGGILKKIPNFKEIISYKYVFDSFWAGELINLNDNNKMKKYLFS